MGTAIRVLIVDDSADDALLLADEIAHAGLDVAHLRVDTPEAMQAALVARVWDIIIADYKMPRFSGPDALKLLQGTGLDIPLILVSGTAGEHTGIDMMRAGAADFIMKHNLGRLVPAVLREIGEAESRRQRKRAEDLARASAESYRALFGHAPSPIVTYDRDAVVIQVNPAFEQVFGFAADEVVGRHKWETFAQPRHEEVVRDATARVFAGETIRNAEYELVTKAGTPVYVLTNVTPVRDERGETTVAVALMTDITERRQAEAHMRDFYRHTILAATDGKLLVCDKKDIDDLGGVALGYWSVGSKDELNRMRTDIARIAREEGMAESQRPHLLACSVESAANAIKHANGGCASLLRVDDSLLFMMSDSGPGIGALALPEVALVRGYSTTGTLGMGYKIMIHSADKVYLATGPEGTNVAVMIGLRPPAPEDALSRLPGW